jgi:hypothetical protein
LRRDGVEHIGELPRFLVAKVREGIEAVLQRIENSVARDLYPFVTYQKPVAAHRIAGQSMLRHLHCFCEAYI